MDSLALLIHCASILTKILVPQDLLALTLILTTNSFPFFTLSGRWYASPVTSYSCENYVSTKATKPHSSTYLAGAEPLLAGTNYPLKEIRK